MTMANSRAYPFLKQLETDTQLQARIESLGARIASTFEIPAKRRPAFESRLRRSSAGSVRLDEVSGMWRL